VTLEHKLRMRQRDVLAANRKNETPLEGEFIYETDTGRVFIGDGATAGGNFVGPSSGWGAAGYTSGYYYMPDGMVNLPSGGTMVTGTAYFIPFTPEVAQTFDTISASVTVADAGGSFRLAVYDNDFSSGMPGSPLEESTTLSTAGTGVVGHTFSGGGIELLPVRHWLAFQHTGTAQFKRHSGQALAAAIAVLASPPDRRGHLRDSHAYGAFPDPAVISSSHNAPWPALFLRAA